MFLLAASIAQELLTGVQLGPVVEVYRNLRRLPQIIFVCFLLVFKPGLVVLGLRVMHHVTRF